MAAQGLTALPFSLPPMGGVEKCSHTLKPLKYKGFQPHGASWKDRKETTKTYIISTVRPREASIFSLFLTRLLAQIFVRASFQTTL
jgi:hypothetical protein